MKVKVNPLFILILVYSYIIGSLESTLVFFSIVCIHDLGHFLVARFFDAPIESIEFMPFGCEMNMDNTFILDYQRALIYLAGPMTNLALSVFLYALKAYNIYYIDFYDDILFANICIGFLNLLPFYPLDGSVVFSICLSKIFGNIKSTKVILIVTELFASFLLFLTIYSLINGVFNISFGIVGLFLILQCHRERQVVLLRAMEMEIVKRKRLNNRGKFVKGERICVSENAKLFELLSSFNSNKYYIIEVVGNNREFIATITEEDILDGIINNGYDSTIRDII